MVLYLPATSPDSLSLVLPLLNIALRVTHKTKLPVIERVSIGRLECLRYVIVVSPPTRLRSFADCI